MTRISKACFAGVLAALSPLCAAAGDEPASKPQSDLPKAKQTALGLYVTAKEAYEKWKADPAKVKVLDVRTPEEYLFVGHPEMAMNIPLAIQTLEWDAAGKTLAMKPNPQFVAQVKEWAGPDDIILATCRSGGRGAMAVNMLAKAGFKNVYNITDGVEGDPVDDPTSVNHGKPMKNGWKNSALPWTYQVKPDQMRLPKP